MSSISAVPQGRRPALRRRKIAKMGTDAYLVVADIIRKLPEADRQAVADHFATEFNRRSTSFDPVQWERATGGRPAPNSARK